MYQIKKEDIETGMMLTRGLWEKGRWIKVKYKGKNRIFGELSSGGEGIFDIDDHWFEIREKKKIKRFRFLRKSKHRVYFTDWSDQMPSPEENYLKMEEMEVEY